MILVFYACLVVGGLLLAAEVSGRFTVPAKRVRPFRRMGLVAAAGPGLAPILAWLTNTLDASWPFPLIAAGYLVAFALITAGVVGPLPPRPARRLRQIGYLGLLALAALPSWVLLIFAPLVLAASLALVEAPERSWAST